MTRSRYDVLSEYEGLLDLLRCDAMASARELLRVSALLHEARELVRDEARARSLSVIVVGVPDEVFVSRVRSLPSLFMV